MTTFNDERGVPGGNLPAPISRDFQCRDCYGTGWEGGVANRCVREGYPVQKCKTCNGWGVRPDALSPPPLPDQSEPFDPSLIRREILRLRQLQRLHSPDSSEGCDTMFKLAACRMLLQAYQVSEEETNE